MDNKKEDWLKRLKLLTKALEKKGVKTNLWTELETKISGYELDFTEHDKVFEDKIAELEKRIQELETIDAIRIDEKRELKKRIAELEILEDRHQSDCIEINRLNTTIDVLIHKVEYLRQFA